MNLLDVGNISVDVEGKRILNELTLGVEKGETHAVFGPNGSGKTTLLMTLLGVPGYRVAEGSITFNGRDITNMGVD